MNKFKGFVTFSSRLREMTKEPEPELELDEEIDYEDLLEQEKAKVSALEEQINDLKQAQEQLEAQLQQEKQDYEVQLVSVESALQTWKKEVQQHCGHVFEAIIQRLLNDPRFQEQMLTQQLVAALTELSDQKNLTIEVPAGQLEKAQVLLSAKSSWNVIPGDGKGGVRFQAEELQWDQRIDAALEEILEAIGLWNRE